EDGTSVELRTYTSCEFDTVHYVVHGMGHTWPPHDPLVERVAGQTSHNLVASEVIWEFLSSHA
ncbi:MAG: polyhydroxybutyrate depolymerase, partial [Actinobacteria bacterium]|nr:polyhydroxybutyrate depolymerase [Actinomycetota bacterium]